VKEALSECAELCEAPESGACSLERSVGAAVGGSHLELAAEVVGDGGGEVEDLIAVEPESGDDVECGVLVGFAEELLLCASAVVEGEERVCAVRSAVRDDDLVLVLIVLR
jgi:hypothetical protein